MRAFQCLVTAISNFPSNRITRKVKLMTPPVRLGVVSAQNTHLQTAGGRLQTALNLDASNQEFSLSAHDLMA